MVERRQQQALEVQLQFYRTILRINKNLEPFKPFSE